MAYFVTGATGFIGRVLIAELLKREGTIYALCRATSLDKLDELRLRLGTNEKRLVAVVGDLSKERLGVEHEPRLALGALAGPEGAHGLLVGMEMIVIGLLFKYDL